MLTDEQLDELWNDSIMERQIVGSEIRAIIRTVYSLQKENKQTLKLLRWFVERTAIDHSYTHTPEYAEALQLVKGGSDNVHG